VPCYTVWLCRHGVRIEAGDHSWWSRYAGYTSLSTSPAHILPGGIGSATGKLLHAQGAKLALLYAPFEANRVESTIEETYGSKSEAKAYECDITSPDSVEQAFASIAKDDIAFPSILVNAAGYVNLSPLESTPPEDSLKHYMINLFGPTLTSQAFARMYLAASKQVKSQGVKPPGGRIVSLASQAGHVALHNHGAYCASKAGLIGLSKCMASEWGPHGITANTVSPGPVWTALGRKAWSDQTARETYQAAVSSVCLLQL
jgi:NAD(P)-dependent dehydrogenase (short-subunit alcohol dehydrogenase family)